MRQAISLILKTIAILMNLIDNLIKQYQLIYLQYQGNQLDMAGKLMADMVAVNISGYMLG